MAKAKKPLFDDESISTPKPTDGGVVVIDNVGPIDHVEIPLKPGRVTLLTGPNGAGKTHALKAINALAGLGTDEISLKDGKEAGRISGFNAQVKLTLKQNRRTGLFDVLVVEEGFSLARFVRPPHKSAESNDSQRLKDLASLLGVQINMKAVHDLVGGPDVYRAIVSEKTAKASDPSEYLKSLKADCDRLANEKEKQAAHFEGEADTLEGTLPEQQEGESDAAVLTTRLTNARNAKTELENDVQRAKDSKDMADRAREVIKAGQGESVADAESALTLAQEEEKESSETIKELERLLDVERKNLESLQRRVRDANENVAKAKDRAEAIKESQQALDDAVIEPPTDEDFAAADRAIKEAEDAFHLGEKLRAAADTRDKVKAKRKEAEDTAKEAERLRKVAQSVFNLLVEPINKLKCGIEVCEDGRLVCTDHKRGRCYIDELSPGEGYRLAFRLMVSQNLGEDVPAIVAIPQEAFEGLDGINRKEFLAAVDETQLMVVTAKASEANQPITAELLDVE